MNRIIITIIFLLLVIGLGFFVLTSIDKESCSNLSCEMSQRNAVALYHDEAVLQGIEVGIGSATAISPPQTLPLTVADFTTINLQYQVGKTTIQTGGFIRFSMRHVYHWSRPQIDNPISAGYVTVQGPEGVTLEVIPWPKRRDSWNHFLEAFPWQHTINISEAENIKL